jgi:hypothetical protein
MLTMDELGTLRAGLADDPDRARLLSTLRNRARQTIASMPHVPRVKALLSRDGGFCPDDGAGLRFDPWSPEQHTCPRCGRTFSGDRHYRHWARAQHLWLAERIAELTVLAAVDEDAAAAGRAVELLAAYEELYFELPNRDNVLGPSHLFFSTYLESLWITSYIAGAFMLREAGLLSEERIEGVNRIADEAAGLIGEFNEGLSNRQTWNAAALTAIAAWFGDEDLARTAVESRAGLLGHLADGFGADGLWWEGENYHLFALRGLMQGIHWARAFGFDLLELEETRTHFRAALLAPGLSALPDLTYPARHDSRFGVSLAQPAFLELWEIGRSWLSGDKALDSWLAALYAREAPILEHTDAWLHDAGQPPSPTRTRADLSWWAFTAMGPPLSEGAEPWAPASALLGDQGLAILRTGGANRYASLECGSAIGGHGHPDRLHLTLHASGVHWLPDLGTGSYVRPDLAWYRSGLAHNAPLLDGENAGGADAWCEAFAAEGDWGWCRGKAGDLRRTVVSGPNHILDVLELGGPEPRLVELPWHLNTGVRLISDGNWEPAQLDHPFVSGVERFVPAGEGPLVLEAGETGTAVLRLFLLAPGATLMRAQAPGIPTASEQRAFYVQRGNGATVRWIAVLDSEPADAAGAVTGVVDGVQEIEVRTGSGVRRYRFSDAGLGIEDGAVRVALGGLRPAPRKHKPLLEQKQGPDAEAIAPHIMDSPSLDGTLDGFDTSEPLTLDTELQYRRSEAPYDPELLSAEAWVNRDERALYIAVDVRKPELVLRPEDAAPLDLDNEPDDIHADGLQLYLSHEDTTLGYLVVPAPGGRLHVRALTDQAGAGSVRGAWSPTDAGCLVTIAIERPELGVLPGGTRIAFDLVVNEMRPDRQRRAGQLVWSGDGGWVYLRGDRHDIARWGSLVLG